jgi:hypothetical protein
VEDVLEPYKKTIDRWLWPDVLRKQDTSISKAKQAISDYKKAGGEPEGLAELMVFYCERAAGFCSDIVNEMKDISMHWCARSSGLSSSLTHYQPPGELALSPG